MLLSHKVRIFDKKKPNIQSYVCNLGALGVRAKLVLELDHPGLGLAKHRSD